MSIAPPGYPPDETDPGSGNRQADDTVQYEFKSVQAVRGRVSSAKAKWQNQGWEFVSENRGKLRTELNFRRVKPKTFGAYLLSFVATLRRLQPKTQLALVASSALILVAGIIGIGVGTQSGGDTPNPSAAQTTASTAPPAEPTVTGITVDELPDDAESSETSKPSETPSETSETDATESSEPSDEHASEPEPVATPKPKSGGGGGGGDAPYFENCDAVRAAGRDPLERGDGVYEANTHMDRDGDGMACE